MNELFQLLRELKVPAIESKVFVRLLDENSKRLSSYQQELELEINSKETE